MNKIYLMILLFIISIGSSFSQEGINVEALNTEEQARKVASLYIQYNKVNPWTEDRFLEKWRGIHQNPNYCMFIAYDEECGANPIGFIDGTVFCSLFHNALMRVDSVYIDVEKTAREETIYRKLWDQIETFAREKGATEIHTNSGSTYDQERRVFAYTMEQINPEKSAFFRKKLRDAIK
jgi:hypothetical protein